MELFALIVGALLLAYIGIMVIAVLPYHIYFRRNREFLEKKGITNVNDLMADANERMQINKKEKNI